MLAERARDNTPRKPLLPSRCNRGHAGCRSIHTVQLSISWAVPFVSTANSPYRPLRIEARRCWRRRSFFLKRSIPLQGSCPCKCASHASCMASSLSDGCVRRINRHARLKLHSGRRAIAIYQIQDAARCYSGQTKSLSGKLISHPFSFASRAASNADWMSR